MGYTFNDKMANQPAFEAFLELITTLINHYDLLALQKRLLGNTLNSGIHGYSGKVFRCSGQFLLVSADGFADTAFDVAKCFNSIAVKELLPLT